MNEAVLYSYSAEEARQQGELALWRASHQANIACKTAIEQAIFGSFDGMHLKADCLDGVLRDFGYKRTAWVLANTLQQKAWDGRFSPVNQQWSRRTHIPLDPQHNSDFVIGSHPAVLDGAVTMYRERVQALGLFEAEQCLMNSGEELDYTGQVLVLDPDVLKEEFWTPQSQLWYACDGFGCRPHAIGRSIRAICLGDGETAKWNRSDFVGILKDEYLPEWAAARVKELRPQQTGGMKMEGR